MAEVEYKRVTIDVNEGLMAEVERLAKEGWQLVPGVQPFAVYELVRQKNITPSAPAPVSSQAGMGTLGIDDSKIFLMRDGKLVG